MAFILKYWGVRGSLPTAPSPEEWVKQFEGLMQGFFKDGYFGSDQIRDYIKSVPLPHIGGYGTATTCVELTSKNTQMIIDGGSGIRRLSEKMMSGQGGKGTGTYHIFLTHFHWDHLIGLPFFAPHFVAGNTVNYYAVQPELEKMIRGKFSRPYFPVSFESLGAKVKFHKLEPRQPMILGEFTVTPYQLDHPDPCWGFRVEAQGKSYAHCVDTEATRSLESSLGPDLPLYRNADLMYFDAQYTLPELAEKANWGHSAAQVGLDIAFREKIKHVIFAHHDPGADIHQIEALRQQTQEYYEWRLHTAEMHKLKLPKVLWRYAYEGLEIDLEKL
ncbi:MAG: MBL fold metallo-hydrolase [Bdellovibrio sp.]|nr:MAG: MBL fold metallo-hydrolase [Bdellovibrio sp.]